MMGFPNLKLALNASFDVGMGLRFNPSFVATGPRYGIPNGQQVEQMPSVALFNAWVAYKDGDWEASLGVLNLTGTRYDFPQGYRRLDGSGGPPVPGQGREVAFRLGYRL
jgi:outer membrane receptor protein involved in Fe transport